MPRKLYRIRHAGSGFYEVRHPDGYWIGPGLGEFRSVAAALDWLASSLRRFAA